MKHNNRTRRRTRTLFEQLRVFTEQENTILDLQAWARGLSWEPAPIRMTARQSRREE